ncbi:hypothetical protein ACS0TY_023710 [Phlomoides rotata]
MMESGASGGMDKTDGKGKRIANKHKGKKTDRTWRPWIDGEEKILLDKLVELVGKGWKTDNGFKPGYQLKLERMMLKSIPNTDICATPHINSKIIMWKRSYGSLRTILIDSSGVGFNTTTHLLDCDDDQWARAVKVYSQLSTLYNVVAKDIMFSMFFVFSPFANRRTHLPANMRYKT